MTGDGYTADQATATARVPRWLWWLAIFAAVLTIGQSAGVAYMGSGWASPRGTLGLNQLADCDADRFCAVSIVRPGSPAARAGIVPGDRLRLDAFRERRRTLVPGERIGTTVRHAGSERHVDLVSAPKPFYAPTFVVSGLASIAVCLIALLILARAGRRWWSFLLGCSLVSIAIPGGYPRFWQNDPAVFAWFFAGLAFAYMSGPVLMLAALRGFRQEVTGRSPRWLDRLLWATAIAVAIATVWGTAVELDSAPVLGLGNGLLLTSLTWSASSLLGPLALAAGWGQVAPGSRTRYAFMWAAVSVSSIHPVIDPIIIAAGNNYVEESWPVIVQLIATIAGALLFAYAILRHHVIDLGFAINRTLVFSVLSFVTLIVFGLVEWATGKFLPFESHEANAAIEAGVALMLYLVFHHVHSGIEKLVERLFFHHWHINEAALHRFLHHAGFVTSAEILLERAVLELKRFSGGADVSVYRAAPGGYERVAGDTAGPALLDTDAPALVAMRADRAMVRDACTGGDLALPMVHRAEVTGFFVLGPKPGGDPYRVDEDAILAEAVLRIGLDLYALRVEELEAANALLTMQLDARRSTRTGKAR